MTRPDRIKLVFVIAVGLVIGFLLVPVFAASPPAKSNVPFPGAPPLVTHQDYKEEACIRCHGDVHEAQKRGIPVTDHPERTACRQCHMHMSELPLRVQNSFGAED